MAELFKNKKTLFLSVVFLAYLILWLCINVFGLFNEAQQEDAKSIFTNTYGVIALLGGVMAILVAREWGGFKSLVGRAITFFGLGLLAQEFGQLMYAYYIYAQKVEVPYPSLGDIGYFGSVLLYIAAIYTLFKATGSKFSLASRFAKLQVLLVPAIILISSYAVFLKDYEFAETPVLTIILDFGYPLLQALYLSLAVLVLSLSRKYLGGLIKPAIVLVLMSLVVQYIADFSFLHQVQKESWAPGGSNDLIYLIAYFVMSVSLLRFETVLHKVKAKT